MDSSHSRMSNSAIKIHGFEPKCPICLEYWFVETEINSEPSYTSIPWVLGCGHMICESCLMKHKLTNRACHMCREKFTLKRERRKRRKAIAIQRRAIIKEKIEEELEFYHEVIEKESDDFN